MQKNQFIPSIHSCNTVKFRVLWPEWSHPLVTAHPKTLLSTFNLREFVWTCKKSGFDWIVLQICWLKNPAIWLDENVLTLISGTKCFIWDLCRNTANNMNFDYRTNSVKINDKIFQQIQKTLFFGHFWSKPNFSKKSCFVMYNFIWVSRTMPKFRKN